MAETIVVSGNNYSIPDQGDAPPWGTGLTSALVAMAAALQTSPAFMQFVNVAATPTTMVSAKTYLITTASLAITMNLPSPAQNAWFILKDVSANAATRNITVHRFGAENIDGSAADKVLSRSAGRWVIMCDGTNWWTLNEFPDTGLVAADYAAGSISNVAINAAAAIAYSKLALTGSILNADINASAAIALTKLAALTINLPVISNGSGFLTTETQLAIVRGGTNSAATLSNNRVMKSSGGAIVEAAALTSGRICVADGNGIPVTGVTGDMNSTKITGLAAASVNGDAVRFEQINGFRILQIVSATQGSVSNTTSTSYVDANLSASITASAATSKILVFATLPSFCAKAGVSVFQILRDAGAIVSDILGAYENTATAGDIVGGGTSILYLDSPGDTSAHTYKAQIKSSGGQSVGTGDGGATYKCRIVLMEIG